MRKSWKALAGAAVLLAATPLMSQQTAKEAEKEAGTPVEYEKILRPADKHEIMGRFVGTWKGDFKVLLYTAPHEATMTHEMHGQWILKDNFLEIDTRQDIKGSILTTKTLIGYNGSWKRFYHLFLTDGEPRGTYSLGVLFRAKNALVFTGMEDDPISGDAYERRDIYTFVDKDKIGYQLIYRFLDGSEMKVVDGFYTRVQDAKPK
jgi:hypothetical protein